MGYHYPNFCLCAFLGGPRNSTARSYRVRFRVLLVIGLGC